MNRTPHVESPCISVCQLDEETGLCIGCWRTRDEIASWSSASNETRLGIIGKLHERRDMLRGVRRRRANKRKSTSERS